jgi:recombination protein RecA
MNAALLRTQLESTLKGRFPAPFATRPAIAPETISIPSLDQAIGGLPRGGVTEICGPESSGRTAMLLSIMARVAARGELCALLDAQDRLDPHSAAAAGIDLTRLLWIRCQQVEQALRSAELLIEGGGFGVVAVDLAEVPSPMLRRVPLSVWFRLRGAVSNTHAALILLEREPTVGTPASLVVRLEGETACWSRWPAIPGKNAPPDTDSKTEAGCPPHARLLSCLRSSAEALRSKHNFQPGVRLSLEAWRVYRGTTEVVPCFENFVAPASRRPWPPGRRPYYFLRFAGVAKRHEH